MFSISVIPGIEPIPVPVAGWLGLMVLALLMLTLAIRRHSLASGRT